MKDNHAQSSRTAIFCVAALAFLTAIILLAAAGTPAAAQSESYSVLYSFTGGADGTPSYASFLRDAAGNLYGTSLGSDTAQVNLGTVFKLDPVGTFTILHQFSLSGVEGSYPRGGLVRDAAHNLYGTTSLGGDMGCGYEPGCGTLFKVDPSGTLTVLHTFEYSDGSSSQAALYRDSMGNLYGTAANSGNSGCGTVFRLDPAGAFDVLHTFAGATDGCTPLAGLIRDTEGNFYGATRSTIFKLDSMGTLTTLYTFSNSIVVSTLVRDLAGNLYGTTYGEGNARCQCGTVFKLDPSGTLTVLHAFAGGTDGMLPEGGALIQDSKGVLYGTTFAGGNPGCYSGFGCGTAFKLDPGTGRYKILHVFTDIPDGAWPTAGLAPDGTGNLVGTTYRGGTHGYGTIFKISTR